MKKVIIYWLNPKNGIIYLRLYSSALFYEVGEINQYGHIILAIAIIKEHKLKVFDKGIDMIYEKESQKIKNKIIDKLINKLIKLKG